MAHCVVTSSKEFKELYSITFPNKEFVQPNISSLAADVSLWQEKNGLDKFPSVSDLNNIKLGVSELFESNPELATIGTQEQYSQYLDTIFPNSKVKDIVYHGSPKISKNNAYERLNLWEQYQDDLITEEEYDEKIKQFPENTVIEKFDKSKIGSQSNSGLKKGFYFSTNKKVSLWNRSNNLYRVIVNLTNPQIIEGNNEKINFSKLKEAVENGDVIYKNTIDSLENNIELLGDTIVAQEPEQIHILGSKQDIEGFKEFIGQENNQSNVQYQKQTDLQAEQEVVLEEFANKDSQSFNQLSTDNTKPIQQLESKLKQWFTTAGIQYNAVEDLSVNGSQVVARADTLRGILEVVEGRRGVDTLAEEAAHFLFDMLPEGHPIRETMLNTIQNTEMYRKVSEEYADVEGYDEFKIRKEAIGKLIAQEVLNKIEETDEKLSTTSKFNKFVSGILGWVKAKFKFLSSNDVYTETEAYKTAAELLLDAKKTQDLIDHGGLKKYTESNWNGKLSDYMYQQSAQSISKKEEIIGKLSKNKATLINGNYVTEVGEKLKNRVSDYVKRFYSDVFNRKDLTTEEATYRKLKGTYIHKIAQLFINNSLKGLPTNSNFILADAQQELIQDPEFTAMYREIGNELWSLGPNGYTNITEGLTTLLNDIVKNNNDINALIGKSEPFSAFTELVVYDKASNVGGTIDLAIVYPNGVVGIYDFKSMNFSFTKEISSVKMEAFGIQLEWYEKILRNNYGVTDFKEKRIIPIDVRLDKRGKIYSIRMDADYLKPIPINEFTGNKEFDAELKKLYAYAKTLRGKLRANPRDVDTKTRLFRIEKAIRSMIVDKELKFLGTELNEMAKELETRSNIDSISPEGNPITDVDINEMMEFINAIKGTVNRFSKTVKDQTPEQIMINDALIGKIVKLQDDLLDKSKELLNRVNPEEDIDTSHKQIGFFSRLFSPTFDIDSPIIRKLQTLIQEMSYSVVKETNEVVRVITEKKDNLEAWAKSRNISLMDAYDLMINQNRGTLVSMLSRKYYEDKKGLSKLTEEERSRWIKKYHSFDKALFTEKRNEAITYHLKSNPGNTATAVKKRELLLENWDSRFNAETHTSAINENNGFLKINQEVMPKEYFDSKWAYMQQTGNEALKDFYDTYIEYNQTFAAITGKRINKNFLAEVRKDVLNRAVSNGVGSVFNMKQIFLDMLEVRQEDDMMGTIDPTTGEIIPNIPLLYSTALTSQLSSSELKAIEAKATSIHPIGSDEYLDLVREMVSTASRDKGLTTKSHDMARSLVLFAKSAYTYQHLSESEAYVKNLKYYIENRGGITNLTDGADVPKLDKFTNSIMTIVGVPPSEIELIDNIIQSVWYGRSVVNKDKTFNQKSVTDSKGNVIGNTTAISMNKMVRGFISYVSVKALGLNPYAATGNLIGTRSNLFMMAGEGTIIDKSALQRAGVRAYKDRKRYMAITDILQPFAHNRAMEQANDLSVTKMEQLLTMDNAYVLMKHPDEQIDRLLTNTMAETFGVDENGKIKHKRKLGKDYKSVMDHMVERADGSFAIEGISDSELARFRVIIFKMASKVKGSTPDHMKASFTKTLTGKIAMHFRNWMPGLITARFMETTYDPIMEDLDGGRFRVAAGEIFNSGSFGRGVAEFGKLLSEAFITGYFNGGLKKINMNATEIAFDKFKLSNPEQADKVTIDDFVEMRKAKLQSMAVELRMYLLTAMLMLLGKSVIPDKKKGETAEEKQDRINRFFARNGYLMASRGFLEISFFFQPSSIKEILKSPLPSMQVLWDAEAAIGNFAGEISQIATGDYNQHDKTPLGYYTTTRFLPFGNQWARIFDVYEKFNDK